MEQLINDMLDLSKLQAHTLEYNSEKINLSESVEKLETYYTTKFKNFTFEFSFPKVCEMFADKKRIEQVLTNLINNAINYSQNENKKIIVKIEQTQEGNFKFSVQDFGIGISEQDKKLVFDRHFRSQSAKRAVAGSGVGLTIVKEILNHYNFAYGVESEVNKGSTFFFEFPKTKIE